MRVGSLFSGIGGLDLGLERAGMQVVWQVENNPFCQKVLKKHWPEVFCYGDIKEIDFTTLPPVDLICGGFPCQPVSCAGKRQGDQDKRWLWPEFYRAICEASPRWVLVENVPGLLSASDGRLFGGILRDLARRGYDAEWDLFPAAAFGAFHERFRLFLVAYPNTKRLEKCRNIFARRIKKNGASQKDESTIRPPYLAFSKYLFSSRNWPCESVFLRKRHGLSGRVDRLKALGNAVVPQVAEWIGRRIMEAANLDD